MFFTYILQSKKTDRYYIGSTNNIEKRLARHNSGQNKATKFGIPWILVHKENFFTKHEAYSREFQIKRYKGGDAFKKLMSRK